MIAQLLLDLERNVEVQCLGAAVHRPATLTYVTIVGLGALISRTWGAA